MAIRYTAPAGGRSRYCVYLIASAASTATATSSCARRTSARPRCVSTKAATSPRRSGRRGRSPTQRLRCHQGGAAAPCAWVCDRQRWRPSHRRRRSRSAPGGSSRRRQPCPAGRLVPTAERPRPSPGPRLNHRRSDGKRLSVPAESVVSSNVGSRYEVVLEVGGAGALYRARPALQCRSGAIPSARQATSGMSIRQFQYRSGGSRQSFADDQTAHAGHGGTWPAVPPGDRPGSCGWVVTQTRPKRSRISVWISSFDRVASMRATNSLR